MVVYSTVIEVEIDYDHIGGFSSGACGSEHEHNHILIAGSLI